MAIMKVIEIMAESKNSWEDATKEAVEEAGKTVKNIRSAWIKDQSLIIRDGKEPRFRVTARITFEVKG